MVFGKGKKRMLH